MKVNFLASQYIRYLLNAKGAHSIHSAFVFDLFNNAITDNKKFYDFQPIELLRNQLLKSDKVIEVMDFGAGSGNSTDQGTGVTTVKRKVSDIARLSSVSPKKGRLLFRLINYMQPKVIIELGTSLGISTLYQQKASPESAFYTLEGSPETANIAAENFKKLNATGISQKVGNFKDTLPNLLNDLPSVDYVFFDGNHRKEATLGYYSSCLQKTSENALLVFDDIRWSRDMYEAWNEIIRDKRATVTIDLFSIGLVFLRKSQQKEHFVLRF